jgi:hypothetical protein
MFSELINFASVRSVKDAFVFYCAYFLLIFFTTSVVLEMGDGFFSTTMMPEEVFRYREIIRVTIPLLSCIFLEYRVIHDKGLLKDPISYVLLAANVVLTFFGGELLGMILVAYHTTKNPSGDESIPVAPISPAHDSPETKAT